MTDNIQPTKEEVQRTIEELEELAKDLFGTDCVSNKIADGYWGYDVTIKPQLQKLVVEGTPYLPSRVVLSFDEADFYMTIDGYRWEFNNKLSHAKNTMIDYLKALALGRVTEKQVKILGKAVNSKLIIS